MGKGKSGTSSTHTSKLRPALTPEAREKQLIALAYAQAEQQLLNGTAPAPVVTHFLKQGSMKEKIEKQKLEKETELLNAKTENIKSEQTSEELYGKVLDAMKRYSGQGESDDY
jgi:hypothetical protein